MTLGHTAMGHSFLYTANKMWQMTYIHACHIVFSNHLYPGVPTFNMNIIHEKEYFYIGDVKVTPIPVMHFKLPILGYRIGNFAYI